MINKLKSSNVVVGSDKATSGPRDMVGRDKINREIGQNYKMYSYV